MSLFDSLGMDQVESDPNNVPDGRYLGKVLKSEHVFVEKKNEVSHVITYQVVDGKNKGAQQAEWNTLGTDPVFDEETGKLESFTPTMTEIGKTWYKKRLVDLVGEDHVREAMDHPGDLKDIPVTFGVKTNDKGYKNISFVELRTPGAAEASGGTVASGLL